MSNLDKNTLDKIKQIALSSGLPFENNIAELLGKIKHRGIWTLAKDYHFTVEDKGEGKVRSIDFICSVGYESRHFRFSYGVPAPIKIHFIVEAKYSDIFAWWMKPKVWPDFRDRWHNLLNPVSEPVSNSPFGTDLSKIVFLEHQWPVAIGGVKVTNNHGLGSKNNDSLADHQIQLSQGVADYFLSKARLLGVKLSNGINEYKEINLFIPILVVNSDIFLLKTNTKIEDINQANDLGDFAQKVSCLVLETPRIKSAFDPIFKKLKSAYTFEAAGLKYLQPEGLQLPILFTNSENLTSVMQWHIDSLEKTLFAREDQFLRIFKAEQKPTERNSLTNRIQN